MIDVHGCLLDYSLVWTGGIKILKNIAIRYSLSVHLNMHGMCIVLDVKVVKEKMNEW